MAPTPPARKPTVHKANVHKANARKAIERRPVQKPVHATSKGPEKAADLGAPRINTRARIVKESARLFAEQGFGATTIVQIEEAVGLSPGSGALYRHFASKQDILYAVFAETQARIEAGRMAADLMVGAPVVTPDDVALMSQLLMAYKMVTTSAESTRDMAKIYFRDGASLGEDISAAMRTMTSEAFERTAKQMEARHALHRLNRAGASTATASNVSASNATANSANSANAVDTANTVDKASAATANSATSNRGTANSKKGTSAAAGHKGPAFELPTKRTEPLLDADHEVDSMAEAFLFLTPILYAKLIDWMSGSPPAGLTHERIAKAWAKQQVRLRGERGDRTGLTS
jgi:AcrR family transcriptional regulator